MKTVFDIPWEVYESKAEAVLALGAEEPALAARSRSLAELPIIVAEDIGGATYVKYDYTTWTENAVMLQPLLRSLAVEFRRDRVVVDFSNPVHFGTPAMACTFSLYCGICEVRGRFAICGVDDGLMGVFRIHPIPLVIVPRRR